MSWQVLDLIVHAPGEEIDHFYMFGDSATMGTIYTLFPNLRALSFDDVRLSAVLLGQDPGGDEGILLSL